MFYGSYFIRIHTEEICMLEQVLFVMRNSCKKIKNLKMFQNMNVAEHLGIPHY